MRFINNFNDEKNILEHFRRVDTSECGVPEGVRDVFLKIYDDNNWNHWIDTSDRSSPPPDFYCDDFKLMMEVMRIDDIGYCVEKKGKIKYVNHENAEENKIKHAMKKSGALDSLPPNTNIYIDAQLPEIPTKDYRNYGRYKINFKRIVDEHKKSISMYRKNHPGFKLIFFIFDESEEYFEAFNEKIANEEVYIGKSVLCKRRHIPHLDRALVNPLINSDIDYLAWYTPYKFVLGPDGNRLDPLPQVLFFELSSILEEIPQLIDYDEKLMVSSNV